VPKLKPETAVLRVVDKKAYKDGAIYRIIRDSCIDWGISAEECDEAIQTMVDKKILDEPTVGYIKRCDK